MFFFFLIFLFNAALDTACAAAVGVAPVDVLSAVVVDVVSAAAATRGSVLGI